MTETMESAPNAVPIPAENVQARDLRNTRNRTEKRDIDRASSKRSHN